MKRLFKRIVSGLCAGLLLAVASGVSALAEEETVLRICNWEEYIDEGGWEEDEVIDLDSGDIFGENNMVEDFESWYYDTYHKKLRVEYSTFGTNEDLYNMLTLGDVFDLVCPSEYMIMKLMAEQKVVPLSDGFFDETDENNYYIKGVSPFMRSLFEKQKINGESWAKYAAGYMWGVTGFVYNPELVTAEEASTWRLIENTKFARQITVKDNVRDTYFTAVGALKSDLLTSEEFRGLPDYPDRLQEEMNDTSPETVAKVQDYLQSVKDNLYSFETDSGKADMITGKVAANLQWSGDAVYSMDQAEKDGCELAFAIPEESTNLYSDGWIMLKCGVEGDPEKQQAAEAFINFVSRPDNAIRNMYYIGYTSVVTNSEDGRILEYLKWNYEAEDEEDARDYSVAHFFLEDGMPESEEYVIRAPEDQFSRQLAAQYPSRAVLDRSSIMVYFDDEVSERTNRMWINIRCFNIKNVPVWCWILSALIVVGLVVLYVRGRLEKKAQAVSPESTAARKRSEEDAGSGNGAA